MQGVRTDLAFTKAPDERWARLGACRDHPNPNLWFPSTTNGGPGGVDNRVTSAAKKICATCPVRDDCLEYALDAGEQHGIWGGTSERERRRIRRERAKGKRAA